MIARRTRPLRALAEVALGRQRSPAHESGPHMVPYLRAANVKDGVLDLTDVKEMNFTPSEQAIFGLKAGDVLVTEGSGSLGTVGASAVYRGEIDGTVCFQNTLLRLRPREGVDPRYLAWWGRHAHGSGLFASAATGVNIHHLSAERVRALPVGFPPLPDQRAIADFLDAETARIDALVAKNEELVGRLGERFHALADKVLWEHVERVAPLMHLTAPSRPIMYGIVLPGPDMPNGVPIVKGGDVARGHMHPSGLSKTTREIESRYARSRLAEGDLVFAIRGGVGDVIRVPAVAAGANITQDVARISPSGHVSGRWLLHVLRSSRFQEEAAARVTGATVTGLNIRDLKRIPVPVMPIPQQERQAAVLDAEWTRFTSIVSRAQRQIGLMRERRQALITAAVTGEMEVPGVAA